MGATVAIRAPPADATRTRSRVLTVSDLFEALVLGVIQGLT